MAYILSRPKCVNIYRLRNSSQYHPEMSPIKILFDTPKHYRDEWSYVNNNNRYPQNNLDILWCFILIMVSDKHDLIVETNKMVFVSSTYPPQANDMKI